MATVADPRTSGRVRVIWTGVANVPGGTVSVTSSPSIRDRADDAAAGPMVGW